VLPVGSTEQHGPHLPLDTDSILAEYFAREIAAALDAALLPTLRYGTSLEHTGFRGSISLRPETLMQVIRDLADEVEQQGFATMIVVNGHGGNHCLVPVARDINRTDRMLKILLVQPGSFCDPALAREGHGPDFHAGEWETSLMLAIRPDLVGSQRPDMPIEEGEAYPLGQADLTTFGLGHLNPAGVIGQPSLATQAKGRAIVASVLENIVPHLRNRLHRLGKGRRYAGTGGIALRPMTAGDLTAGMRLVEEAGWNQTEEDWQLFLRLGPNRCFVAVTDGQVVGTVTTLDYEGQVAWISMLLVDPVFRHMGIGSQLFDRALDTVSSCRTIALDATPAGQGLYARRGFEPLFEIDRLVIDRLPPLNDLPAGVGLIAEDDWPAIAALDRPAFGADRTPLLRALWNRAPQSAWRRMRDKRLVGYCFGRRGTRYVQVGPIVAETNEDAVALCGTCMRGLAGRAVVLDVPTYQPALRTWLERLGFSHQRSLARMVLSPEQADAALGPQFEHQFAIAGPELG